ncbi:MAG: hypothetical protein AAFX02_04175 [Pseudomonadota bacterium]
MLPFIIMLYAAAFSFAALAALRLPSMALIEQLAFQYGYGPEAAGMADFNWRHISILLGGPYLAASIAFYVSAILLRARWRGAGIMFKLGAGLGFACLFLFEFRADWWHAPTDFEWIAVGAGCATLLIYLGIIFVYESKPAMKEVAAEPAEPLQEPVAAPVSRPSPKPKPNYRPKRRPRPGPAIMVQRAAFAAQGQRMLARRAAARQPIRWRL